MIHFVKTENTITIFIKGVPETVDKTNRNFDKIVACVQSACEEDEILRLIDIGKAIQDQSHGLIEVKNGVIYYEGEEVKNQMTNSIFKMLEEGFDISPFLKFMENLMENPSYRAVHELYGFLENSKLPITNDGHFLAYKKVRPDFKDIFTGTFDNSVGAICEMKRNKVNEDKNQTCSNGLHFAAYSYMSSYGDNKDVVVVVKINPRDVVAIPTDYNNAKGRCCRYEVVDVLDYNRGETIPDNFKAEIAEPEKFTLTEEQIQTKEQLESDVKKAESNNTMFDMLETIQNHGVSDDCYKILETCAREDNMIRFARVIGKESYMNSSFNYNGFIGGLE